MADVDPNVLMQMLAAFQRGSGGDGPGMFDASTREQMKALSGADTAALKVNETLGKTQGTAPPTTEGPSKWDSFLTAMNTPTGAAGLAYMLGGMGAAISPPNTWQSRLGTTAAGWGQNAIAADRYNTILSKLGKPPGAPGSEAPSAPNSGGSLTPVTMSVVGPNGPAPVGGTPAATSNFQSTLLSNPPQAEPFKLPKIQDVWLGR